MDWGLTIYMWMVIIRALISWVNPNPYNPAVRFLAKATDPALYFVRKSLPMYFGGIDFSPVILILLISFLQMFLVSSLAGFPGISALRGLAYGMPISGLIPIFVISLIRLIQGILFAYMIIVIVRAVLSWISPDPYNPIVRFVYGVTEPVMYRLRTILPLNFGGLDFTPMLLILALYLVNPLLDRLIVFTIQAYAGSGPY